ncbi:MAG TPA: MbnP family protein [Prosthecobacter sp.]
MRAEAQVMEMEVQAEPRLPSTSALGLENSVSARISRLDFLLSKLALQKEDGTWVESADWFAFYSLTENRLQASAEGVPAGKYKALRFEVGVPAAQDLADPNGLPPGHALHPLVNRLHWGWQGGYVYMALEGRWQKPGQTESGFSFHLARTPNRVPVVLKTGFQGGGPLTVRLGLDTARLFTGVDFEKDGNSTHSREGDAVVAKLVRNVAQSFRIVSVSQDLYQPAQSAEETTVTATPPPPGTHAYPLDITSRFPKVSLPADNPLTREGVALGKSLFHDVRLSVNNSQSCASCHTRSYAFSDPRVRSLGAEGTEGRRHAMPLFNLAWAGSFFWDGRAGSLREQVLRPIQDRHEMNERLDRVVAKLGDRDQDFAQAFGSPGITADKIAKALEQYLLTLVTQESRFDRAARKVDTLTEQEKRGLQLFVTEFDPARGLRGADCFHCHGGTLFTDHQFKNNGLKLAGEDLGRMGVTGNAADRGKFKTPSLRNIAATAPYMHDGRFATLEEVVEHYSSGVQRSDTLDPNLAKHPDLGLQLTAGEKQALVAFLKTLTDDAFIRTAPEPARQRLAHRQP